MRKTAVRTKKVYATFSDPEKKIKTGGVKTSTLTDVQTKKKQNLLKENDSVGDERDKINAKGKNLPFDLLDKKSPDDYIHIPGMQKEKPVEEGYNPFGRFAKYIPTQEISGSFVRVDAYKEITEGTTLDKLQKTVFLDRYSMRDDTGKQLEIFPEQLWKRISRAIASVEKTDYLKKKWEDKFYNSMTDFKFVPAGRILSGAGTGALVTYYNCFVIPSPEDSRTGIIDNLKIMTEIMARSGGVGINLSTLRPRGSYIKTVNGHSSGPMAWAQLYSVATGDVISQGGCFAPNERIATNKGLIKALDLVERLEKGERILAQTHQGFKPFTFSFRNGQKETFLVVTKKGLKVQLTAEHKMGVLRNGEIETIALKNLLIGDEILMLLGESVDFPNVKLISTSTNEGVRFPDSLNSDLAYLLGFSYGERSVMNRDNDFSLTVTKDHKTHKEIKDRIVKIIKEHFSLDATVEEGKYWLIKFNSSSVIDWLKINNLLPQNISDVRVPEKIFESPSNISNEFISGLIDANGASRDVNGSYEIKSISFEMLHDIQLLLITNGVVSNISSENKLKASGQTVYRLEVTKEESNKVYSSLTLRDDRKISNNNFSAQIGENLVKESEVKVFEKVENLQRVIPDEIVAIIPSGRSEVYDFEVEGVHMLSGSGFYTSNSRRGALMLMLDDNHPDIEEFITVKKTPGMISHANLSVCISDAFMEAVKNDAKWDLLWKGEVMKTVDARHVWDLICTSAWENAEPGVVFTDRYNKMSNTWYYEDIRCTNPCVTGDTLIYTDKGLISAKELAETGKAINIVSPNVLTKERVNAYGKVISGNQTISGSTINEESSLKEVESVFITGVKDVFKLVTKEGYTLRLTDDHKVLTDHGWKEAKNLESGDKIRILNAEGAFGKSGNSDLGKVLGWLIGDGYVNTNKNGSAVLSFFGSEQELAKTFVTSVNKLIADAGLELKHQIGVIKIRGREESRIESSRLLEIVGRDVKESLRVPESVFVGSREMQKGFISGLFSADGSVQGDLQKGVSVRLTSISEDLLEGTQKLLLNFGIASTIYRNRREEGYRELPNHKDGNSVYKCQAYHELVISNSNLSIFSEKIGFLIPKKQIKLEKILSSYSRNPNKEEFFATFVALLPDGRETVYDLTEPDYHLFVANGLVVHNCGEQGLGEWQVCNLGSINLAAFVREDGSFDYDELEKTSRVAMRFLDNVIDSCYYFFQENKDAQLGTRRTGLGTMGLADALIKMKLRYGSEEALKVVEKIYALMRDASYDESADIALEKGAFPMFIKDKYLQGNFIKELPEAVREKIGTHGIRNAVLLSQAPTGTISLFAGVSSGIEPVFAFAMERTDRTGTHHIYHPLFEEWKKNSSEDDAIPEYFVSSADLSPEDHIRIQAVIQKYTDSSISKTVNAPNGYSVENVKKLYRLAYDLGCKGVTFYREGSRDAVLTTLDNKKEEEKKEEIIKAELKNREELLTGVTYKTHTPVGSAFITINSDSAGNIFEVFINVGKAGSDINADATALGRIISLMFQVPSIIPSSDLVDHVINRLEDIGGASSTGFGAKRIRSLADAVAKVLAQHVGSNVIKKELKIEKTIEENKRKEADFCPECGQATLVKEEGCQKCYNCGFSKC